MNISPAIFKAYDVRGKYPQEINEEIMYRLGRAFVIYTQTTDVMVGCDARTHSPSLQKEFIRGCLDQGANVTDVGLSTTSQIPAMRAWFNHDAAAIITASHLDPPFNGVKAYSSDGRPLSGTKGWPQVQEILTKGVFSEPKNKGSLKTQNYIRRYAERLHSICPLKQAPAFVVDCSCGGAGEEMHVHKDTLKLDLHIINDKPDGTFPAHSPNPIAPGASDQASKEIFRTKSAGGCIFDADADRVVFLDEAGNLIHPNYISCLLSEYLLRTNKDTSVCYDLISSRALPQTITAAGGKAIRTKVGYANVRDEMIKNDSVFGAESSSHLFFRDTAYAEATGLSMLYVMKILAESNKPLSELVKPFMRYALIPETNFLIEDKDGAIEAIVSAFSENEKDYLDGVSIHFKEGWLNARKSNTEPLLRIRAEGDTHAFADELMRKVQEIVASRGGKLFVGGH